MATAIKVRELQPSDSIAALTELLHRAYADLAAAGLNYTATTQGPDVTARRCAFGTCLVAEIDGKVVGTLTYHNCAGFRVLPPWFTPTMTFFEQFGVDRGWQGKGVGRALLAELERRAIASNSPALFCDTAEPASDLIALYQRGGFRVDGHVQWDGKHYRSVWLVKWL